MKKKAVILFLSAMLAAGSLTGCGSLDENAVAVSVNDNNAAVTAETVRRLTEMGVKTVLGLSNVSFGLPNRNVINGEFLRQMIEMKLTAAIINPTLKPRADKYARKALAGQDKGCADYIANVGGIKAEETVLVDDRIYNQHAAINVGAHPVRYRCEFTTDLPEDMKWIPEMHSLEEFKTWLLAQK